MFKMVNQRSNRMNSYLQGKSYSFYRVYKRPTEFVVSVGKCGNHDYLECRIWYNKKLGMFEYIVTDGYGFKSIVKRDYSIIIIIILFDSYIYSSKFHNNTIS